MHGETYLVVLFAVSDSDFSPEAATLILLELRFC